MHLTQGEVGLLLFGLMAKKYYVDIFFIFFLLCISVTSFHLGTGSELVLPQANKQIKTETTIGLEEMEHNEWISEWDFNNMPSNVKNEVALVFGIKEMKSMLQFTTQGVDKISLVTLSFHWGDRPWTVETKGKD